MAYLVRRNSRQLKSELQMSAGEGGFALRRIPQVYEIHRGCHSKRLGGPVCNSGTPRLIVVASPKMTSLQIQNARTFIHYICVLRSHHTNCWKLFEAALAAVESPIGNEGFQGSDRDRSYFAPDQKTLRHMPHVFRSHSPVLTPNRCRDSRGQGSSGSRCDASQWRRRIHLTPRRGPVPNAVRDKQLRASAVSAANKNLRLHSK
jgi:hypothetical protein